MQSNDICCSFNWIRSLVTNLSDSVEILLLCSHFLLPSCSVALATSQWIVEALQFEKHWSNTSEVGWNGLLRFIYLLKVKRINLSL